MPSTAIVSGVLLILLGIISYVIGLIFGNASLTALIPAGFGLLLAILGYLSETKENLRKHLMHVAVLIALVGFVVPLIRLMPVFKFLFNLVFQMSTQPSGGGAISFNLVAAVSQLLMSLICLVFVILSVKSFIKARRDRVE